MNRTDGAPLLAAASLPTIASREGRVLAVLCLLLICLFAMGGGSRPDIASLAVLRPVAIAALAFGLFNLTGQDLKRMRLPLMLAAAVFGLELLHLVPLPSAIWHGLPGHEIVHEVDQIAGLDAMWRPLSLSPEATRNAVWGTVPALSVLVLASQLGLGSHRALLALILFLGLTSACLSVMQLAGDPYGSLYPYAITNNGDAVGLFANRNHQALLLAVMLPMLAGAVWMVGENQGQRWLAMAVAAALATLLIVSGSRLGLVAGLIAAATIPFLDGRAFAGRIGLAGSLLAAIAIVAAIAAQAGSGESLARLAWSGEDADFRIRALPTFLQMTGNYWPWGSGIGTFETAFRIAEPDSLLGPAYANHAHNDLIELIMTGGLPAALLVAGALFAYVRRTLQLYRSSDELRDSVMLARLGSIVVALLTLASLSDYPLRVPSLGATYALGIAWMCQGNAGLSGSNSATMGTSTSGVEAT